MKPINLSKENFKKLFPYAITFGISYILLSVLVILYATGFGNPVPDSITAFLNLFNGLAGICFLYYLKHSYNFSSISEPWQIVISCAYGLCSYALVQECSALILSVFALFPLVFFAFEQMINEKSHLPFVILSAVLMILSPECAAPAILLLFILSFFELKINNRFHFANILYVAVCFLFAFMLAGFRVILCFSNLRASSATYSGFHFVYSPFIFLSRFLPQGSVSFALSDTNGMDLYFGILFLLLVFYYFCNLRIAAKNRICYAIFTIILIASVEISPVKYVFNFFTEPESFSLSYSFILIFWFLRIAALSVDSAKDFSKKSYVSSSLFLLLFITCSFLFTAHNFVQIAIPATMLFAACIIVLFYLYHTTLHTSLIRKLLFTFIGLELFCNAFVVSNEDFIPDTVSSSPSFAFANYFVPETTVVSTEQPENILTDEYDIFSSTEYDEFVSSHKNNYTISVIYELLNNVPFEESEYTEYCATSLPDFFEEVNAKYYKIGGTKPIFTPFECTLAFEASNLYDAKKVSENIYNFTSINEEIVPVYIPYTIQTDDSSAENIYITNNADGYLLLITPDMLSGQEKGYFSVNLRKTYCTNVEFLTYRLDPEQLSNVSGLLRDYLNENDSASRIYISDYIAFISSALALTILLLLLFDKDKVKFNAQLKRLKENLNQSKPVTVICKHFHQNSIYYWSFLIPVLFFLTAMIVTDCTPFGANSFYDEDGVGLTLPTLLDFQNVLEDGNTTLSMNGGYGNNMYSLNTILPFYKFLLHVDRGNIAALFLIMEGLLLGFGGFSFCYYMTHRLTGLRANKRDYRLLLPVMIYTLNTYMLAMHSFVFWYFTLAAFPVLLLAMDYLMYKKKTFPYIFLLSFCMFFELYITLSICIFLVIRFFTYHFEDIKDFFRKGIRFALCSILSAGNVFFLIANTLFATSDSGYKGRDEIFPSFGFHTNFLNQWKNHMVFSSVSTVTSDRGYISIYCGVLTLLLVIIYFCSRHYSLKDKLRKIIPIIILYLTFNGQVLSYVWYGFHYQTKVPNRHVFLLMFLLAEIAYDGFRQIKKTSIKKAILLCTGCILFFVICQFFSDGNSILAFVSTLILCFLFFLLYLLYKKHAITRTFPQLLTGLLILEMFCNMIYTVKNYSLDSILLYGDYPAIANYIDENLTSEEGFYRICYPTIFLNNYGKVYHSGSNSLFNSYVSSHQSNLNEIYGFIYGSNMISANYASTPFGMSLSNSHYIFVPFQATGVLEDLDQYNYLGRYDCYYIYENPTALSLGFYTPYEAEALAEDLFYIPIFCNKFASLYTHNDEELFVSQYITYDETGSMDESFYFEDITGTPLTYEEASSLYEKESPDSVSSSIPSLRMILNYTPAASGHVYFYPSEFVSIGKQTEGTPVTKNIAFPNGITQFRDMYNIVTMNREVFDEFYDVASRNQLENITIENDTITGTTNYEEAGYTILSLAYDPNWHAYIDGESVEIKDFYNSCMFVETPAGEHTLQLKYIPSDRKPGWIISFSFLGVTILIHLIPCIIKYVKKRKHS